jgi:hypothetical protein
MKARVELDKRNELDKKYDAMWNKLCRDANLNPRQKFIVSKYIRDILGTRMNEVQAATEMAYMLALIEVENCGTRKGSTRLLNVQDRARQHIHEAYGSKSVDANGVFGYDGCGYERLVNRLVSKGVEYDGKVLEE